MEQISMRDMLAAGVHFGHQTRYWNPKMAPYIFGARNKVHIINLEKTMPAFETALTEVRRLAAAKKKILFVGTKRACAQAIREQAIRVGMPYVDQRWLGGMLTNYRTVRQSVNRLLQLESDRDRGVFSKLPKREVLQLDRMIAKLARSVGGIRNMNGLPDALFVVDVSHERIAVREANKVGIPVIGVVDTNSDPQGVDFVIPGNDDAIRAVRIFVAAMADAILEGRLAAGESIDDIAAAEREMLASYEAKNESSADTDEGDEEDKDDQASEGEANEGDTAAEAPVAEVKEAPSEASSEDEGKDQDEAAPEPDEVEAKLDESAGDAAESEADATQATADDAAGHEADPTQAAVGDGTEAEAEPAKADVSDAAASEVELSQATPGDASGSEADATQATADDAAKQEADPTQATASDAPQAEDSDKR